MSRAAAGPHPDARVLARARRTLTVQLAAAVTLVVAIVGALVFVTMLTGQRADTERDLRYVIARGSVASPPPCVWMFAVDGRTTRRTPNAPAALPLRADLGRVARDGRVRVTDARAGGVAYTVRTERRGGTVMQAAVDLRYQVQERRRLLIALAVAELGGLIAAVVTGQALSRRAIAPLEEALDRQTRFVADVSHELRTPLTRLHTRAQMLVRQTAADPGIPGDPDDPDDIGGELRRIVADTRQFGEVIDDLLLSARLRRTDGPGEPVDLAGVLAAVAAAEAARADGRMVTIEVGDHPMGAYVVNGVCAALRRVVGALVDNALDHVHPGGRIELRLAPADGGRTVELTVADDGVGFDPSTAGDLFERYARGAARTGAHSGLGLALAREVVERHDGRISAAAAPGQGATFTVRLPLVRAPVPRAPRAPVAQRLTRR
ncbi:MAG TPA: HAMP domain-containing sensor histidine kinase [Streptosporangiaceae bacterium]